MVKCACVHVAGGVKVVLIAYRLIEDMVFDAAGAFGQNEKCSWHS